MRDREVIEREMYKAREDLEESLAELRHVVQEKVDVKARAKVAIEKGKLYARDAYDRGAERARELADRGRERAHELSERGKDKAYETYQMAKDRPYLTAAIIGGIVAAGVLAYVGRQKHWW